MNRDIERITLLVRAPGQSEPSPRVLYRGKKRRRRNQTGGQGWLESFTRNTIRATSAGMNNYLDRHERSNKRNRDGWLYDLPGNLWAATCEAKQKFQTWNDW
jgi:hypothetical protein